MTGRPDIFAIVPIALARDKRVTLEQMRVMLAILSFRSNSTDIVWPKRERIAERSGVHVQNVSAATSGLVKLGWLVKDGAGSATTYRVVCPATVAQQATVTVAQQATVTVAQQATVTVAQQATVGGGVWGGNNQHLNTNEQTSEQTSDVCFGMGDLEMNGSEKRQQDEPLPSASPVDDIRLGGLCRRLRVLGIDAAPHLLKHPDWQALLGKHSDEAIVGAAELARDRKPNERLSLGYLVPMLNQPPKPPPRGSPVGGQRQSRADRNAAFFERLGVGNGRSGEVAGAIDGSARRVG